MLVFIGLGLYDEMDLSLRGLEEARACDVLYAEFYTSRLGGADAGKLEEVIGREVRVLSREEVESGELLLNEAMERRVGFLVPGDPLISTTHAALRIEAARRGIGTRVVHNASIHSAAPAISGLFNYKFGASASIPFPTPSYRPESFYDVIKGNRRQGLHTLLFLDISERAMTAREAIELLLEIEGRRRERAVTPQTLVIALACVGSEKPVLAAAPASELVARDLGPTPHVLIVPGKLHFMEEEYLKAFAGL